MLTTALHDAHLAAGAKMGAFAGYDMPLYYPDGVLAEHGWTRSQAGLFDVSHMGQLLISGPDAARFLEYVTPSAIGALRPGRARYTVLTAPDGGIIDDLIITRLDEGRFFVVVNAGGKEDDSAWLQMHLPETVTLERLDDRALLALQGPAAEEALRAVTGIDTASLPYMALMAATLPDDTPVFVSRLGYTGEDGFEISLPAGSAADLWAQLLADPRVRPVGLAARDSLRLEMGYCLYGHDIDRTTTPIEADLSWVIGRNNRNFIGHEAILQQREKGAPRRRVGLRPAGKAIAREGMAILDGNGNQIGQVTSGGFSPTLQTAIAQGYIDSAASGEGLQLDIRGRLVPAALVPLPFTPARTKAPTARASNSA